MAQGRKLIDAAACNINGINLKSKAEARMYSLLKGCGMSFLYEPESIEVLPAFTTEYWHDGKLKKEKARHVTYLPDFVVYGDGVRFIIDVKGYRTEMYKLRKKLFLGYMSKYNTEHDDKMVFMEVSGTAQMLECLAFLREHSSRTPKRGT